MFQTKYISAGDFLRNGFVLVIIMFWATMVKVLGQQGHYHIVITESGHIKSALQVKQNLSVICLLFLMTGLTFIDS